MKGVKVTQAIFSRLSMFRPDGLQLNCDLNDCRPSEPNEFASVRRLRLACCSSKRNINNPIVVADLLMMSQFCNEFARRSTLCQQRT